MFKTRGLQLLYLLLLTFGCNRFELLELAIPELFLNQNSAFSEDFSEKKFKIFSILFAIDEIVLLSVKLCKSEFFIELKNIIYEDTDEDAEKY